MKKPILLLSLILSVAITASAKVTLPSVIATNAVLQQNESVTLWGKGEPNQKLTIRPSWTKQKYTTTIDDGGEWEVQVQTTSAGGGYTISFDDGEITTIENIMLGEVWLCMGQSNMRMIMHGNGGQPVEDLMNTILQADSLQPVRYFRTEYQTAFEPESDVPGKWSVNAPRNIPSVGATPYFFAQYLQSVLKVPVGVVECARGGSKIESWMSPEMLRAYKADYEIPSDNGQTLERPHHVPSQIYNGELMPLKRLKFKGALWYQGEANLGNSDEYPALFKIFVESLRSDHFDNGVFPFYYAQIAPYGSETNYNVTMREVQANMVDLVERTGMVVLSDIGEEVCIHPRQKRAVGNRFAYWALADTYGYKNVGQRAPEFNTMQQLKANDKFPKRVGLHFKYAPLALCFADANVPSVNFEVAGEDRVFYPATARIGSGKNHIEVWSDEVEDIVAVRYGFHEYFKGDVFNSYGIPISSFRTDDWEL